MRERLIELIKARIENKTWCVSDLADYLIANGVVVMPCKVGDTVYEIVHGEVSETEAVGFMVCQDGAILLITRHFFPLSREIGCSVFLTKEDAERALKVKGDSR